MSTTDDWRGSFSAQKARPAAPPPSQKPAHGSRFTAEEDATIMQVWSAGGTVRQTADITGRAEASIRVRSNILGVKWGGRRDQVKAAMGAGR